MLPGNAEGQRAGHGEEPPHTGPCRLRLGIWFYSKCDEDTSRGFAQRTHVTTFHRPHWVGQMESRQ